MKTIVFILILLAGVLQTKAQIVSPKNPGYQMRIMPTDTNRSKFFIVPGPDSLASLKKLLAQSPTVQIVHGSMTVVKLPNNDQKMPIVQTDRTGYTMPVMGMSLPGIYNMKKPDTTTKPWP